MRANSHIKHSTRPTITSALHATHKTNAQTFSRATRYKNNFSYTVNSDFTTHSVVENQWESAPEKHISPTLRGEFINAFDISARFQWVCAENISRVKLLRIEPGANLRMTSDLKRSLFWSKATFSTHNPVAQRQKFAAAAAASDGDKPGDDERAGVCAPCLICQFKYDWPASERASATHLHTFIDKGSSNRRLFISRTRRRTGHTVENSIILPTLITRACLLNLLLLIESLALDFGCICKPGRHTHSISSPDNWGQTYPRKLLGV